MIILSRIQLHLSSRWWAQGGVIDQPKILCLILTPTLDRSLIYPGRVRISKDGHH